MFLNGLLTGLIQERFIEIYKGIRFWKQVFLKALRKAAEVFAGKPCPVS